MKKKLLLILLLSLITLTSCNMPKVLKRGSMVHNHGTNSSQPYNKDISKKDFDADVSTVKIDFDKAIDIFINNSGDDKATILSMELISLDGRFVYDILGHGQYGDIKTTIDANTGEILNGADTHNHTSFLETFYIIRPEEAMEKALLGRPNDKINSWILESTDYGAYYEFEFQNGQFVIIDAYTGERIYF